MIRPEECISKAGKKYQQDIWIIYHKMISSQCKNYIPYNNEMAWLKDHACQIVEVLFKNDNGAFKVKAHDGSIGVAWPRELI